MLPLQEIVSDISAFLAVLLNEPSRTHVQAATSGFALAAPGCITWEIGDALRRAVKRERLTEVQAVEVFREFERIPVRILEVDMEASIHIATRYEIPMYDAYYLQCAEAYQRPLLTLDNRMRIIAVSMGLRVV